MLYEFQRHPGSMVRKILRGVLFTQLLSILFLLRQRVSSPSGSYFYLLALSKFLALTCRSVLNFFLTDTTISNKVEFATAGIFATTSVVGGNSTQCTLKQVAQRLEFSHRPLVELLPSSCTLKEGSYNDKVGYWQCVHHRAVIRIRGGFVKQTDMCLLQRKLSFDKSDLKFIREVQ